MIHKIELTKTELENLKKIVNHTVSMIIDDLKEERKQWYDPKPLAEYWWEMLDIKEKLLHSKPVIRRDNLSYYGNYEDKPSPEEYYKSI